LKWFWIEAWMETNFCKVFARRNLSIALSRRLNGK
jgi:hypothetical protein